MISLPNWLAGNQRSNSAAGPCSKPAPKDCWARPMPTLVALQM